MPKRHRNKIIISSLVILGVILIVIGTVSGKSGSNEYEKYVDSIEAKLEDFLKSVDGINEAKVIITLEESEREKNEGIFGENSKSEPVPKVRGVAVACTNGDNYEVQNKITMLVSSYLGVPTNKIKIVAIK